MLDTIKKNLGMHSGTLTAEERRRLADLEATVDVGLNTWAKTAAALAEIRDKKLYRDVAKTFAEYVDQRWQMKVRHVYRLMRAEKILDECAELGTVAISTAEELAKLPPADRAEVIKALPANPTLAEVEELVEARQPRRRRKNKSPRPIIIRGAGWKLTIERRRHEIDIDQILIEVMNQRTQQAAA